MALIKVKVKTKLITEGDLEWDEESMGKVTKSREWVWSYKILDTQYFFELTELTKATTILQQLDGTLLLIKEPLDVLYKLWNDNYEEDLNLGEELSEEFLKDEEEDD